VPVVLAAHLALLFCAGVLAHGRLAGERPEPEHLTGFYVLLSVGGVLGGAFNALVAPVVFDTVLEYPLAIALALLLRPRARTTRIRELALAPLPLLLCLVALAAAQADVGTVRAILAAAVASLLLFTAWPRGFALAFAGLAAIAVVGGSALYTERTFFGVLRVSEGPRGEHVLAHGTTVHGVQRFRSGGSAEPLSYYSRSGPIGDVFASYARTTPFRRIGVVGLGVGTLAAYGRPGQTFEFYEIDPAVIEVASDPRFFTYLRDSRADVRFTVGDGRRSLAASRDGTRDLIVVDAFSSDSIPVHLLTREAVALYLAKLRPEGLLAVHVSNRHLQLAPVLAGVADSLGVAAAERFERISERDRRSGRNPSHWVVVARSGARLTPLLARRGWRRLRPDGASRVWTDDFSNVLSVIDWSR
jgi:hypothetical protein